MSCKKTWPNLTHIGIIRGYPLNVMSSSEHQQRFTRSVDTWHGEPTLLGPPKTHHYAHHYAGMCVWISACFNFESRVLGFYSCVIALEKCAEINLDCFVFSPKNHWVALALVTLSLFLMSLYVKRSCHLVIPPFLLFPQVSYHVRSCDHYYCDDIIEEFNKLINKMTVMMMNAFTELKVAPLLTVLIETPN